MEKSKNKISSAQMISVYIDRYFRLIIFLLVILILLAGYFLVLNSQVSRYLKTVRQDLPKLQAQYQDLKLQNDRLKKVVDSLTSFTKEERRLIDTVLPAKFDFPSLVIQVSNLAKSNGFVVTGISYEEEKAPATKDGKSVAPVNSNLKKVKIKANFSGEGYDQFKKLAQSLEKSIVILNIDSLSFGGNGNQYGMEMTTYYYQETK